MNRPKRIEWAEFEETYKPVKNPIDPDASYDGFMLETYGAEFEEVANANIINVWTIIECDDPNDIDETIMIIVNGRHYVNRMGYIITEKPWSEGEDVEVFDE